MSDMRNESTSLPEADQATRAVPPVEPSSRPPRHRRSERYAEDEAASVTPASAETPASSAEPPAQATPAEPPRGATRVMPVQGAAARPAVPRPPALDRAERPQQPASGEQGTVRRPMGTPAGFAPRQPSAAPVRSSTGPRPAVPSRNSGARRPAPPASPQSPRRGHRALTGVVVALLVIGLILVGVLAMRGVIPLPWGQEAAPALSNAATASGFTATINRGTAPIDVIFNLTTTKAVSDVRLVNDLGYPMEASCAPATENAESIIWVIDLPIEDGFEGTVHVQVFDGTNWIDTGMTQDLEIAIPLPSATVDMAAFQEVTEAPTEMPSPEPTAEPTEEPTEAPAESPTPEAEPTPTLDVTNTPVVVGATTNTLSPADAATQVPVDPDAIPTEAPTPETVEPLEVAEVTEAPTETPTAPPTATPPLTGQAAESADPSLIYETVIYDGTKKTESYTRAKTMNMPIADAYLTQPFGVVTYRGNAFRQNAAVGAVPENVSGMEVVWTVEAGSVKGASSTYYGIGWTGQPAIIKWSKQVREASNIVEEKRATSALKEVIVAGMDGYIYFLDLADGQPTREAINLGYPMRGTPSLHPLGYPIMTVGQYGRKMASGTGPIGLRFYNLLTRKEVYRIDGLDGSNNRPYYTVGAFDTSALIDPNTDTLVTVGTNGMLYTVKLNTEFSVADGTVSIDPASVAMKSKTRKQAAKNTAVQSSPAMYGSYVYYADMEGILRCVDTTTMTTVWAVDTDDAVEAAIALDMDDNGRLWLYTANTLDVRSKGDCSIRRYDALTGEESWTFAINVATTKNKKTPGAMASPVIGQYGLEGLVYFTLSGVSKTGAASIGGDAAMPGLLLALDKDTGKVVWTYPMDAYSYSSPVAVYDETGRGLIVQACSNGVLTLLDGLTGQVVNTLSVEGTIDASPAVYNGTLVIGTTGKNTSFIYGIRLQ